jgi:P2 family phage contractile tail tube protein
MALPKTLKNMLLFNDGNNYLGESSEVTLPKLARKFDEWKGGGMDRPVALDKGGEILELEATFGGPVLDVIRQYGETTVDGVYLRFIGAYQNHDIGALDTVEVIVRGRHEEIDFGNAKPGENGEFKIKMKLAYYKLNWNGKTEVEIDPINMVEIVGGVDRLQAQRAALGMF